MKAIPIYKFYAAAFNYKTENTGKSKQFSIAIQITLSLLLKSFSKQSDSEIRNKEHQHPLVKKFIQNAIEITYKEYEQPFDKLEPLKTNIIIDQERRISFKCIVDSVAKKIIVLNFGREENLYQETSALVGLFTEFQLSEPICNIEQICYWCLGSGNIVRYNFNDIVPFSRTKILQILTRISSQSKVIAKLTGCK